MIEDADFSDRLSKISAQLFSSSQGRIELTKFDPQLFAFIYLREHITDALGNISFSPMHNEWYRHALDWVKPTPTRSAYVAPRHSAKSTMWFTIIPLWAAAHGHKNFIAAFASTPTQAEIHLSTFKFELENNQLLKLDFPTLCAPMKRESGSVTFDRQSLTQRSNGFVFAAAGVDSPVAGLKVGSKRPDVLIFDDIEPHAANYSKDLAAKREHTLLENLFYLNTSAKIIMVGTVTMEGSIIHQLVQSVTSGEKSKFVIDSGVETHYYPALKTLDSGEQVSIWETKWSTKSLLEKSHTRDFQLNMMNLPVALDGDMFRESDFFYEARDDYSGFRTLISIDPAVTVGKKSDYTGIAVVSYDKTSKKMYVRNCLQVKLSPAELKHKVAELLEQYEDATNLLVETNQGGDTWKPIFQDLPARYVEIKQSKSKTIRAKLLLTGMQNGHVAFCDEIPQLMNQMLLFPTKGINDDMLDAVSSAYLYFTGDPSLSRKKIKPSISQGAYV